MRQPNASDTWGITFNFAGFEKLKVNYCRRERLGYSRTTQLDHELHSILKASDKKHS